MKEENKSIHEFEYQLICDYFNGLERQGPGSQKVTLKALSFVEGLDSNSRIADLGCGTGTQTIYLGEATTGHITGIDLFPDFIETMNRNIRKNNLEDRISTLVGSMGELPFGRNELDLIWSEGAIYNIGFQHGLQYWHQFIKPGGYVVVSEASWFTDTRPDEINDFWMMNYNEIDTIPNKVAQMQQAGYVPVATFIIPVSCWTENFFDPMPPVQEAFLEKYAGSQVALDFIFEQQREIDLYNKYKDYYGYVFYIGKKIAD